VTARSTKRNREHTRLDRDINVDTARVGRRHRVRVNSVVESIEHLVALAMKRNGVTGQFGIAARYFDENTERKERRENDLHALLLCSASHPLAFAASERKRRCALNDADDTELRIVLLVTEGTREHIDTRRRGA
jgi:hypothetical protein